MNANIKDRKVILFELGCMGATSAAANMEGQILSTPIFPLLVKGTIGALGLF
jgi:hypothetical protein